MASRAKGIYKPEGQPYALSVRKQVRGPYLDSDVAWLGDTWSIAYHEESDPLTFTNVALRANMRDGVPVGVLEQLDRARRNNPYRVLGIGLVVENVDGYFEIVGPLRPGQTQSTGAVITGSTNRGQSGPLRRMLEDIEATDAAGVVKTRVEQPLLRRLLLGSSTHYACAFCGRTLPVRLITAAHIKPRHACSHEERTDPFIVVAACRLGCDSLFEEGFIRVNASGQIERGAPLPRALQPDPVAALEGRTDAPFGPQNSHYFEWHRIAKSLRTDADLDA